MSISMALNDEAIFILCICALDLERFFSKDKFVISAGMADPTGDKAPKIPGK